MIKKYHKEIKHGNQDMVDQSLEFWDINFNEYTEKRYFSEEGEAKGDRSDTSTEDLAQTQNLFLSPVKKSRKSLGRSPQPEKEPEIEVDCNTQFKFMLKEF